MITQMLIIYFTILTILETNHLANGVLRSFTKKGIKDANVLKKTKRLALAEEDPPEFKYHGHLKYFETDCLLKDEIINVVKNVTMTNLTMEEKWEYLDNTTCNRLMGLVCYNTPWDERQGIINDAAKTRCYCFNDIDDEADPSDNAGEAKGSWDRRKQKCMVPANLEDYSECEENSTTIKIKISVHGYVENYTYTTKCVRHARCKRIIEVNWIGATARFNEKTQKIEQITHITYNETFEWRCTCKDPTIIMDVEGDITGKCKRPRRKRSSRRTNKFNFSQRNYLSSSLIFLYWFVTINIFF